MENLRFDKEGYLLVLVFCGLFYKRNRKYFFPCKIFFPMSRNSAETTGGNTLALRAYVPTTISRSPKLPLVFPLLLWSAYL